MTAPLTRRQTDLLTFLQRNATAGAAPPSLDQACRALGLRSRGSLHKHVRALVDAGLVEAMDGQRRGLHLTGDARTELPAEAEEDGLPLLGRIAAGRPIEAVAQNEMVAVPAWLRGRGECYVLEVRGESMVDDGIFDGDRIVVEHRREARNGELVVALIDGEETTLKRLDHHGATVTLHPANADYAPLHLSADRVAIQGVVIGQMRRY